MKFLWRDRVHDVRLEGNRLTLETDGAPPRSVEVLLQGETVRTPEGKFRCVTVRDRDGVWVAAGGVTAYLEFVRPESRAGRGADELRSPMTGRVAEVAVNAGEAVCRGRTLAVVTAMKMEFRIESPRDGVVASVHCRPGDLVDLGQVLVRLKESS